LRLGFLDHRQKEVLESTRLALVERGSRPFAWALQCPFDPGGVVSPCRWRGGSFAANGGKSGQNLIERQAVALQPFAEQRPIAAGARPAPSGKAPRGQIGIAFLAGQGFEIVGQHFIDGCGANDQALIECIHARSIRSGFAYSCSWAF